MKIAVVIFLLTGPVVTHADEWTTGDTWRESTWQLINIIDWGQTRDLSDKCHHTQVGDSYYNETNPFLGECPTLGEVNRYFAASAVIHGVVAAWLPADWRRPFQYVTIGMSATSVANNISIGLSISF